MAPQLVLNLSGSPPASNPPPHSAQRRGRRSNGGGNKLTAFLFGSSNSNGSPPASIPSAPASSTLDDVSQLLSGISELELTRKLVAKSADAQRKGASALAKWARESRNSAIDDVMQRTGQLMAMYAEQQMQFVHDYEHNLRQLRKIAETEGRVKAYVKELETARDKERKAVSRLQKHLSSPNRRSSFDTLDRKLDEAKTRVEIAEHNLREARAEAEVVKMFQFREGMIGIAESQRALAHNTEQIFLCQREITEFVPKVSTQDVTRMLYEGTPYTRERVEEVRRSLQPSVNSNQPGHHFARGGRRSNPGPRVAPSAGPTNQPRRGAGTMADLLQGMGTPPPPYTPTAPPLCMADCSTPVGVHPYRLRQRQPAYNHGRDSIVPTTPFQPRTNPNRHSAGALLTAVTVSSRSRPTEIDPASVRSHQVPVRIPSPSSSANATIAGGVLEEGSDAGMGRLYPRLSPNPFVQSQQQQPSSHRNNIRQLMQQLASEARASRANLAGDEIDD